MDDMSEEERIKISKEILEKLKKRFEEDPAFKDRCRGKRSE